MPENDRSATAAGSNRLKVFISYSRRDLVATEALVGALEADGFDVTIDRRDLPYGEAWQGELADFIRASDTVVWLVSPDSVASRWCNWELGEVQRLNKRMVPVLIREVDPVALPEALGRLHLLPAEGIFDPALHRETLAATLNTDRAWVKDATRLADRARQWLSKDRDRALLLRGTALADAEGWRLRQPGSAPQPNQEILDLLLASRQAATRRGQAWLAGALALLAVSIGGGVWSWAQKLEADRQRAAAIAQKATAERNYNISIDATEKLAIGLAQDLREATGVRIERIKGILDRAEGFYAELANSTEVTPRLLRSQVWLLKELALTYRRLGDVASARRRIDEAAAKARLLESSGLPAKEADAVLMEVLVELAHIADVQGDLNLAHMAFDESNGLARQNATDDIGKARLRYVLHHFGLFVAKTDRNTARAAFEERVALAQEHTRTASDRIAGKVVLVDAQTDLAWLEYGAGNYARARTLYEELVIQWQELVAVAADTISAKHNLLRALQRLSDVSSLGGDTQAGLAAETRAMAIARELAADRPDNVQSQLDLTVTLNRVGTLKIEAGEAEGARELLDEALRNARRLSQTDPDDTDLTEQLGYTLQWLASSFDKLGDRTTALQLMDESIAVVRRLVSRAPGDARQQKALADRLAVAAGLMSREDATAALQESVALLGELVRTKRAPESTQVTLSHYEKTLADLRAAPESDGPPQSPAAAP